MNVNTHDPIKPAFRWERILDTVAIIGFIAGIHSYFINETFKDTKRYPFGQFLEYQQIKN
jgi:hypothetical protein